MRKIGENWGKTREISDFHFFKIQIEKVLDSRRKLPDWGSMILDEHRKQCFDITLNFLIWLMLVKRIEIPLKFCSNFFGLSNFPAGFERFGQLFCQKTAQTAQILL